MQIRAASHDDLPSLIDIQNQAILNSTASWRFDELTIEERTQWLDYQFDTGYPVYVAEEEDGTVLGYASYRPFDTITGYRYTVENSVYVSDLAHGKGVGSKLMQAMIDHANDSNKVHVILANITGDNLASQKLHRKFGFVKVGHFPEAGHKFDQWLDLTYWQLTIPMDPALVED